MLDYMFREYEKGRTPNPDVLLQRAEFKLIYVRYCYENSHASSGPD